MKRHLLSWLPVMMLGLALSGLNMTLARAQGEKADASGTWTWKAAGQNGQSFDTTLTLRQDGSKLGGEMSGRNGAPASPVTDGAIKDGAVSFKVTRDFNGQSFTINYQGKLSGDSIKGTIEFGADSQIPARDWEAKRVKAAAQGKVDPTGLWKWTSPGRGGDPVANSLNLKIENGQLTGTLTGRAAATSIANAKLAGDTLTFSVTRKVNDQEFTSKYSGKISGDTIKGTIETDFGGQPSSRDWEAKREGAKAAIKEAATASSGAINVTGTWNWTTDFGGQSVDLAVRLEQKGDTLTGVSIFNDTETPIKNGKVTGKEISFTVTPDFGGGDGGPAPEIKYHATVDGDSLTGKINANFGGNDTEFDWNAKRAR